MQDPTARRLRNTAAVVIAVTGAGLVASLWFRPLGHEALFDAVLGAAYLLLGLGLWGSSRLSLWLGIALPGAALAAALYPERGPAETLPWHLWATAIVIPCCLLALWSSRRGAGA